MKSIIVHEFGPPEVMRYEDAAIPAPGQNQVLIKVKAIGVNPVDTYIRAGAYGIDKLPYTPGFDCAGTVDKTGEGVKFKPGDRVYTSGTVSGAYAEYALCNENQVHRLPDKVTFQQGASLGVPYATAYRALFHRAKAVPGEAILVHGASGGVGTAAVQLAKAAGMTVIGTAGTDKGLSFVKSNGADHAVNHRDEGHLKELTGITGGRGVDVILEMLSNVNLGNDLKALAKYGRVVVIGSRGTVEIDPRDAMGKDANILGMSLFNAKPEELQSIHAALTAGLDNGTLCPVIGKEMPLKDAPAAHHAIIEERAFGKIILVP